MATVCARGDLFESNIRALAHGCNCAGAMGKGIAVEFKRRWPAMYEAYHQRCKEGKFKPGDVFLWSDSDYNIFNLGTQTHWRTKATFTNIENSVATMITLADELAINRIAMPAIGAGLGGLSLDSVLRCIQQVADPWHGKLWICTEFLANKTLEQIA